MHYVCKTCGGVSDKPGVCKTEGCEDHGKDLEPCDCSAPEHLEKLPKEEDEE